MSQSRIVQAEPRVATALDVGSIVDRRYRLKREIARGGTGAVFEAEHLFTTRIVAIKVLIPAQAFAPEPRARLLQEARALSIARHRGVVLGLDAGESEDGAPYLVMELLEGRTLEGILAVRRNIECSDVVNVGIQLCHALAAAHERGVLHRDIKPSNIFIARNDAGREVAKLFDFGIARLLNSDQKLTQEGALLGTPEYMAPEQLLQKADIDRRCDIYALGVTLYEALTGSVPFEGNFGEVLLKASTEPVPPLAARCPGIAAGVAAAIEQALAREPDGRFRDAHAFAVALRHALPDTRPTLLLGLRKPPRPPPPPSPLAQRAPGRPTPPPLPLPKRSLTLPQPTSLAAAPPPPIASQSPEQRRRFARAPYVTPVRICRDDGSFVDGRCEDISVGGLLLLVPKMFEQQEHVKVRFALPGGGKLLELPGIARWVKKARGTGAVGFEFSELPPESRDVIERYVTALGGE